MKKITVLIILLLSLFALDAVAQKKVRREVRKGNDAYKEQRYDMALEHYQKALEQNQSSKEAAYNLGNTYYRQGNWDKALEEYRHFLTLETETPENMSASWSNIGNTLLKKKAGEKNQSQAVPQQGGEQKQQADNLQMSMEAYKNALRLNPNDDETRYNLAVTQKMIQDQQNNQGGGQNDKQDKKDDKQDQSQMSQQSMEQILQAIEQDERDTQERVQKNKATERQRKNQDNRQQNKDW